MLTFVDVDSHRGSFASVLPPLSVGRELGRGSLEGHSDWVTHLELHGVRGPDDEGKRGAKPGEGGGGGGGR